MSKSAKLSPKPTSPPAGKGYGARSVPSARPFRTAVTLCAIHYLAMLGVLTTTACIVIRPNPTATSLLIICLALGVLGWMLAYFKRRDTHCPLCKGTPYLNTGARTHKRAWRLPPLNHGTTAILSTLASQRFRCMYCGSDYDLLKPSTRLRHGTENPPAGNGY